MEGFNELEAAVLNWCSRHYANERLTAQVESARFIKREWTVVGFYVYFDVSHELSPLDLKDFNGWPIGGPNIRSPDVHYGGGTMLWGWDREGYINCIEMFAFGDQFNEHVRVFSLMDSAP